MKILKLSYWRSYTRDIHVKCVLNNNFYLDTVLRVDFEIQGAEPGAQALVIDDPEDEGYAS